MGRIEDSFSFSGNGKANLLTIKFHNTAAVYAAFNVTHHTCVHPAIPILGVSNENARNDRVTSGCRDVQSGTVRDSLPVLVPCHDRCRNTLTLAG